MSLIIYVHIYYTLHTMHAYQYNKYTRHNQKEPLLTKQGHTGNVYMGTSC